MKGMQIQPDTTRSTPAFTAVASSDDRGIGAESCENFPAEQLPKRTSLVHATAAALKEWINRGVLGEVLPGELELKSRLGVGRDTLRLALKLLAEDGWVSSATQGQQRRIRPEHLPSRITTLATPLPVTFLSPYPVEHRQTLLEMDDTQLRLTGQGRRLQFISPDVFHLKNPDGRLEHLVRTHPSAAWVLYASSEPMQRWFDQKGLPTFLFEAPFPGVRLPYVAPDWGAAAFHAGIQLARQGHRIVGILEYQERRPGLIAQEQALERAFAAAGVPGRLLVFKDDRTPASVGRSLEAAFNISQRPTALVLTRAAQLLTCYSWLVSRGIRVPADISIVCLDHDAWFDDFHPAISHYRSDTKFLSRSIAERVVELAVTGRVTRRSIRVPMEFYPGATVGPARQDRKQETGTIRLPARAI